MDTAMDQEESTTLNPIHNNQQQESNSNLSSKTSGVNLTEKHKMIQRQLLLLIHADKCITSCTIQQCATMKQVLAHLATTYHSPEELKKCVGVKKCTFPYCHSSRLILTHWKQCIMKSHSIAKAASTASHTDTAPNNNSGKHCSICEPANKYLLLRHYGAQQRQDKKDRSLKRSTSTATLPDDDSQKKGTKKFKQATIGECTKQIWSGNLIWHKQFQISISIINDQDTLSFQIFAPNKKYNIEASNLNMKLIPSSTLTKLGLNSMEIQPITFSFQEEESQDLRDLLKSNHYSGFIYSNPKSVDSSESNAIKFLILQGYDQDMNKFHGWIPIQQKTFIQKLKVIVSEVKAKCFNLEVVKKLNQLNCNDDSNLKQFSSAEGEMY